MLYTLLWLEPVTTPPFVSAGALPPGPRAYALGGVNGFYFLARSENLRLASSSPVGTFSPSHESVTTPPYAGAGALPPGPRAYALGGVNGFYFLARSENLRLASSSPVGAFPSTLANQFMKPTPQEKFTPSTRAAPASQTQRGSGASASSYAYSRANLQAQPNPESYACSSMQPPESRKYLKR